MTNAELLQAAQSLQDLQKQWMEIQIEDVPRAQELMQREADLREDLKDCCYGDPAETWTPVDPVDCEHPVVSAHSDVTRALIQTELGKLEWMLRCAVALGHEDLKSERGNFADLLLKMAELRLRLFDVRESYDLLQRARPLIAEGSRRRGVLYALLDNCLMCECLKTTPSMFGVEISPGNAAAKTLGDFGRLMAETNYNCSKILYLTGAESLIDFSNDDQLPTFAQNLAQSNQSNEVGNLSLAYLIRVFLLRMQEPLEDLFVVVGADCCKLLLELQVVTAVRDGYQLLSVEEAIQTATAATEESFAKVKCFSNVRLWPLEKMIIATDAQTWPYGNGIERFEPVMYLSDDSLALLDAKPDVEGLHLLDMCCGSGVQGISALARNAASVTFSDMNPRALQFVRFNLAINSLLRESCEFCLGDAYSALESEGSQKFDGILANPPFLPNPDGIASQAIALYGNGGAFGEDVLSSIVAGCSQWLVDGGWVLMVTYAPNVEQMPSRLQEYLVSNCDVESIHVAAGNQKDAADFLPVASEVEFYFYPKALKEAGVESLSEALVFVRLSQAKETERIECTLDLRGSLFADKTYVQNFGQLTRSSKAKPNENQKALDEDDED